MQPWLEQRLQLHIEMLARGQGCLVHSVAQQGD